MPGGGYHIERVKVHAFLYEKNRPSWTVCYLKVVPGNNTIEFCPSPTLLKGVIVTLMFTPHTMSDIITLVSSFMSLVLLQPIDSVAVPLLISTQ